MRNDALQKIAAIDLEPIKSKLMHKQSGEGWSAARADAIEKEYRRFLCLVMLHPDDSFAPLVDVDTFWHYHILDTRKYAADCKQAFGYFLHHHPYVGLDEPGADAAAHAAQGARMQALYRAAFGTAPCMPAPVRPGARQPAAWCSAAQSAAAAPQSAGHRLVLDRFRQAIDATAWCSVVSATPVKQATAWCSVAAQAAWSRPRRTSPAAGRAFFA